MTIWTPQIDADAPRYRAIADAMGADIASGILHSGDRLPPQRDLARALRVSIGTVTRAYALAEERGLVRGEVGRGTFVGAALDAFPFADTGQTVASGINLGMSWPLEHMSPDLGQALRKLQRRPDLDALLRYQPNLGMPRHRRAGAAWISRHGLEVGAEQIAICSGSQHGMTVVLGTLASAGDTILTEELTYPGVRAVAEFLGLKVAGVPMDGEGLIPDALAKACQLRKPKAIYCVPSLQNPTTATQSLERREEIVAVARRFGVPIVEDAIHHLLLDPSDAPPLIASLAPELTYLVASPSKVVAGGLRVAFIAAPNGACAALSHRLWSTVWMVAPLVAEVMATWIEEGTADATVRAKRAELDVRADMARRILGHAGLRLDRTGLHAWLMLPEPWSDPAEFIQAAAQRGAVLAGASSFHVGPGPMPAGARLSISAPHDRQDLERGLRIVADVVASAPGLSQPIV